jgi:hypothetical protein
MLYYNVDTCLTLTPTTTNSLAAAPTAPELQMEEPSPYNERALLDYWEKIKKEAFAYRWVWEKEWLRDIFYTINRQWLTYHPTRREWIDKRLNKGVPRPVTNKIAEIVQALRSSFASIDLGVVARPVGHNPVNVSTAEIVDKIAPLLHEEHRMPEEGGQAGEGDSEGSGAGVGHGRSRYSHAP